MPRAIKVSLLDRNMKVAVSRCNDKEISGGEEGGGGIGSFCDTMEEKSLCRVWNLACVPYIG